MSVAEELEKLHALREQGAITETEYARAKKLILEASGAPPFFDPPVASPATFLQTLRRSSLDKWVGGVCAGLGRHTSVPSWCWRLCFCFFSLLYGVGVLLYVLLWIFVPLEENSPDNMPTVRSS